MRHAERCIVSDLPCWSRAKGGETKFWLLRSLQSIEPRCAAQMLRDHLIQSTIISALDKVIQKHPANPKPFKKDKRRRLRKKGEENAVELAEVVVEGPESQAPI